MHTTSLFFSACLDYLFSSPPLRCWVPQSPSYSGTKLPHTESPQASLFSIQGLSPFCLLTFASFRSSLGFPMDSVGKESVCNAGDPGSIPGSGRSPKEMPTHSSILAWRIPWTEEPGRLQSTGSHESNETEHRNHM